MTYQRPWLIDALFSFQQQHCRSSATNLWVLVAPIGSVGFWGCFEHECRCVLRFWLASLVALGTKSLKTTAIDDVIKNKVVAPKQQGHHGQTGEWKTVKDRHDHATITSRMSCYHYTRVTLTTTSLWGCVGGHMDQWDNWFLIHSQKICNLIWHTALMHTHTHTHTHRKKQLQVVILKWLQWELPC